MTHSNKKYSDQVLLRRQIIEMATHSSHVAVSLSCIDILAALYRETLNLPQDSFIFSKGHGAMALYAVFAEVGLIPHSLLKEYAKNGSILAEHPLAKKINCLEFATGSLGHGLAVAAGIAKAKKIMSDSSKTFVLMGDGECNEGSVWEAASLAAAQELPNLNAIIDWNNLQACGSWSNISKGSDMIKSWQAFGWETVELSGHDYLAMVAHFNASNTSNKPRVFLCHTIKGKGVDFMENNLEWHYRSVSQEDRVRAENQLNNA